MPLEALQIRHSVGPMVFSDLAPRGPNAALIRKSRYPCLESLP